MNDHTQEGLVDVTTGKLSEQAPPATARHPLHRPGAGRWLYAVGMAGRALGLLGALSLMAFTTHYDHPTSAIVAWGPLMGLLLQFGGQWLCARAWWHVPLRSPQAPPDAVELVFWSVIALAVAITGCAIALTATPPVGSSMGFSLWVLVVVAGVLAVLPTVERPRPEPPASAVQRSVPLSGAVLVVLGMGVGTQVFGLVAAGVVVLVLGAGLAAQRLWWRRYS